MTAAWNRSDARQRLLAALETLPLSSSPSAPERLLDLCELLATWAVRISLTAHRTPAAILDRLVLDAAALACVLPEARSVADLGSGAGFPGLPLALLSPDCQFTLVEARERKHHFQREAVRQLGLRNVRPVLGRSEATEAAPHDGVIAQAIAQPRKALPLLLPWAAEGGWLALPGGLRPPAIEPLPGVQETEIRRYRVPQTAVERTLWIGRRAATGA